MGIGSGIELIFADDGSADKSYALKLKEILKYQPVPALVCLENRNLGRSKIRNLLTNKSSGRFLLFLDSDVLPDYSDFICTYLDIIPQNPAVVYGGRSVLMWGRVPSELRLHWFFTKMREQVPARIRNRNPAFYFMSSNFLVRRDVMQSFPFSDEFRGWGWEDSDWAARVGERFPIINIDNPASHMGLLKEIDLLKKYDQSVENFRFTLQRHSDMLSGTMLLRAIKFIQLSRSANLIKVISRRLICTHRMPDSIRIVFLMLYKAAIYSDGIDRSWAADEARRHAKR